MLTEPQNFCDIFIHCQTNGFVDFHRPWQSNQGWKDTGCCSHMEFYKVIPTVVNKDIALIFRLLLGDGNIIIIIIPRRNFKLSAWHICSPVHFMSTSNILLQAVPVPAETVEEVKETMVGCALSQNFELAEIPTHSDLKQVQTSIQIYFLQFR